MLLSTDVAEIAVITARFCENPVKIDDHRFERKLARQKPDGLSQTCHGNDIESIDHGRLRGVLPRHDDPTEPALPGEHGRG